MSYGQEANSSFSCIFRRAARIISSLRRCSVFCLSSLLIDQPGGVGSCSFSLPFVLTRDWRLYLVIRSGSVTLGCAADVSGADDVAAKVIGGWKDGGAWSSVSLRFPSSCSDEVLLTGSKPRPASTLSVVACTLPLFRCRSHMISRLLNCGNICNTCSTCAAENLKVCDEAGVELLDRAAKKYLYEKNMITPTIIRDGIEIVASSSTAIVIEWTDLVCSGNTQDGSRSG